MNKVCVIGSVNKDYIFETENIPSVGETTFGTNFLMKFGGKGANQAIAASRLGSKVFFIGACGNDSIGEEQINNFKENNVDVTGLEFVEGPSGAANITISQKDNSIIIIPGANGKVSKEIVDKHLNLIKEADVILLQLEIPLETVEYVVDLSHTLNKKIILNPAPAMKISSSIIEKVDYLIPNEIELAQIFDGKEEDVLKKYPNKIILTKGSMGVNYHDGNKIVNVPALKVDVQDTTGAGDTFNGAFAFSISNDKSIKESVEFANKVAARSTTKVGAQSGMPWMEEL